MQSARRPRDAAGFTLVELMIVGAVLAILASIALPSYRKYLRRARANEAVGMLGNIRERQMSYKSLNNQFADISGSTSQPTTGTGTLFPTDAISADPVSFSTNLGSFATGVGQLGLRLTGPTFFRYGVSASVGTYPGWDGFTPPVTGWTDHWYYAAAYGDLDNDGVASHLSSCSFVRQILYNPNNGDDKEF